MLLLKKTMGKKGGQKTTLPLIRVDGKVLNKYYLIFTRIMLTNFESCVFFSLFFSRIHWSKTIENSYPLVIHGSIFSAKFSIEMLTIYTTLLFGNSRPYNLKTAILYRIFDDSKKVSNQISIGKA